VTQKNPSLYQLTTLKSINYEHRFVIIPFQLITLRFKPLPVCFLSSFYSKHEWHQHEIKLLCYIFSSLVFWKGEEHFSPSTQSISWFYFLFNVTSNFTLFYKDVSTWSETRFLPEKSATYVPHEANTRKMKNTNLVFQDVHIEVGCRRILLRLSSQQRS